VKVASNLKKYFSREFLSVGIINNSMTDPNKILPMKYPWAREYYKRGLANHWIPDDIPMMDDTSQWKSTKELTENERKVILRNLGFFSTAESLTANNLVLAVYRHITNPECRQYLTRQIAEESTHCFVEGTEILTNKGFKDFRDLTESDLVGQYHEDGSITFVKPHTYYSDDFDGNLIKFSNDIMSYCNVVTPDHRCVYFNARKKDKLEIDQAQNLSPQNKKFPVSGKLIGGNKIFSDWDRLNIACQADGTLIHINYGKDLGKKTGCISWTFNFKKERKKQRLKELVSRLNLKIKERDVPNKPGFTTFKIWIPLDHSMSKDFEWINLEEVNHEWIDSFFEELKFWDGCIRSKGRICYSTSNKKCADKVKLLAHLCNRRSSVWTLFLEDDKPNSLNIKKTKDHYQVHISHRYYISGRCLKKENVPYKGKVYCVGVPSGMLMVRYNNIVTISGNTDTFIYCCDSLGLDPDEIYNMYITIPSIARKDKFVVDLTRNLLDQNFKTDSTENIRNLLRDLVGFYYIMEGIFFYCGFASMLALKRRNKMTGTGQQFEYVLRDEVQHIGFGRELINTIRKENPECWTKSFEDEIVHLIQTGVNFEKEYIDDCLPNGIVSITPLSFYRYIEYIADRRLESLGIKKMYGTSNPFPWMSASMDLKKEKNFFETRNIEYQTGVLENDW
jgi:ribonucleotide reductase beta subunit family protein with ferritin-like domain